jgi:uncharacterized surface protein with fasciclin (FAS1) repeats
LFIVYLFVIAYFMNERNVWSWVVGIVVVVVVIGGLVWWFNQPTAGQSGDMASTTTNMGSTTTDTSGTNVTPAPVAVSNNNSTESIATIVAGLTGSTEYAALFSSTGVGATLGARGPYTVFISTDAGYALLKPGTITNMTAAQKKRLIQYSIVSGKALDVNTQNSGSVKALSGDELNFKVGSTGLVQVNSSYALSAYKATNGIVYVLNQPLVPPTSGNILTP